MSEQLIYRDRRNTNGLKWSGLKRAGYSRDDLLGLWVADMDFAAPECVRAALRQMADFGVFGYDFVPDAYYDAFLRWERERHGYEVKKEWVRFSPGVVAAFNWLIRILTGPGDAVLIQTPVYPPFSGAASAQERRLVCNELVNTDGVYTVDFEDFERKLAQEKVKVFLLCSPHNPVGRVWRREELEKMLSLCRRYGVKVIADEIHHDFEHPGHTHIPTLSVGDYDDMVVMLTAPSKTFNLAGLQNSLVIIPDRQLRRQYDAFTHTLHVNEGNSAGFQAAAAAYAGGGEWLSAVLRTVEENEALLRSALSARLPQAVMSPLEGTYLAWLDLSAYVEPAELPHVMEDMCALALNYGEKFGRQAAGHVRLNLATSRENVAEAARRLIANLAKES